MLAMETGAEMKSSSQRPGDLTVMETGIIGKWESLVWVVGEYDNNVSGRIYVSVVFWNSACWLALNRPG